METLNKANIKSKGFLASTLSEYDFQLTEQDITALITIHLRQRTYDIRYKRMQNIGLNKHIREDSLYLASIALLNNKTI